MPEKDNQKIISKLSHVGFSEFCRNNHIELAILFGSRVTGHATAESDFDLAVLMEAEFYPKDDVMVRAEQKRSLLHVLLTYFSSDRIDLLVLNDATDYLLYRVTQEGKLLFEKNPGLFAHLASLALRKLSDGRLFREAEKKYLYRRSVG